MKRIADLKDGVCLSIINVLKDYEKSVEGNLDLILVMNSAKDWEEYADMALGERLNKVYFTPRSTRLIQREQSVSGSPDISNEALIFDDSWFTFESFFEVLAWMEKAGYDNKKISVFYIMGENNPSTPNDKMLYRMKTVLCSLDEFIDIKENYYGK